MNLHKLPLAAAQKALDACNLVLATDSIDPALTFQAVQLFTPLTEYIARQTVIEDLRVRAAAAAAAAAAENP